MEDGEENEEKILYDLSVPQEWPEIITVLNDPDHHSIWKMITALLKACCWFSMELVRNPLNLLGVRVSPSVLADMINAKLSWQLAISSDGKQLAVAKEDCIEIRSILDDFEVPRASFKVGSDVQPQWRKILWNRHGNRLVYANSKGEVTVFVDFGKHTYKLVESSASSSAGEGSLMNMAISGVLFIRGTERGREDDEGGDSSPELLVVVGYNALVTTFRPSVSGYVKLHSVSLLSYFSCGVGAVEYSPEHNLMIVAGWTEKTHKKNSSPIVSCWQLIDESPFWRPPSGQEIQKSRAGTLKKLIAKKTFNEDSLFALSVSPDGRSLAGISLSGDLSLWHLPSCKLKTKWTPDELFVSADGNMTSSSQSIKGPVIPLEVKWWSSEALIVVSSLHKVTVPSAATLTNLLGHYSEPGASVTPACNGQFMMLECESNEVWTKRRRLLPSLSEYSDSDGEEEEKGVELDGNKGSEAKQDSLTLRRKVSGIAKKLLYFLTEMEKFKPPRQKLKKQVTRYSLVCLKSMTPEECYERKMRNEEYGEALALAQRYGLDCDLVYQHQWQKSPVVTVAAIKDYLAHISKRSWVLQECLHCVANDFLTMKELLLYGLHCTRFSDVENGVKEDEKMEDMDTPLNDQEDSPDEVVQLVMEWESLSEEQVFLCQCRESLLQYLDRLNTYEVILGGPAATFEMYDPEFFGTFRNQNLVRVAIDYAQGGNYSAVEALFTRHGDTVLPHRLSIIASFPETVPPKSYSYLLPSISDEDTMEEWEGEKTRERDWVEHTSVRKLYSLSRQCSFGDSIYEENPEMKQYLVSPVSHDLLTKWYFERANEIEEYSGQVHHALSLVEYGVKNGMKGLELLHHHLQTLYSLIYYCNTDVRLSLPKVQGMSHLEVVQLIMREIEDKDFMMHFNRYGIPYIKRLDKLDHASCMNLLEQFMIIVSKSNLRPCVEFLKASKRSVSGIHTLQLSSEQKISIGLKCILACERSDQLDEADAILECLPTRVGASQKALYNQVDELEDFICAADILKKFDVLKPICFFKDIQNNASEAERLIVKLTRVASRKTPPLDENGWRGLLKDIVTLKSRAFKTLSQDTCYKIFSESLLCSGDVENIMLASQVLMATPSSSSVTPSSDSSSSFNTSVVEGFSYSLPFNLSVSVVVAATREYINSATSPQDKEIELAKLCVFLIKSDPLPAELMSELNLIYALDILTEFGVTLLPINVRLCENKLDLIRQVLDSSRSAYKKYDQIFKLSYLLGHSTESDTSLYDLSSARSLSEGKGYTIVSIILCAMQHGDYKLAHKMCGVLMKCKFEQAWEVCKQLGTDDKFLDKNSKLELLDFSLCHCPVEEIQIILRERKVLDAKILFESCHGLGEVEKGAVRHIVGKSSHTLHHLVSQGAGRAVSHLVGQKHDNTDAPKLYGEDHKEILWNCLQSLQDISSTRESNNKQLEGLLPICYHPFYPRFKKTNRSKTMSYFSWRESTDTLDIVLHQAITTVVSSLNSLESGNEESSSLLQKALKTLCKEFLIKDTHMMLGCLLSLKPEAVDDICSQLPKSCRLSYQIPVYCTCLHIYTQCTKAFSGCHPYQLDPSVFTDHVIRLVTCVKQSDWPEICQPYVILLLKYKEHLDTHLESQTLEGLEKGIDVMLFYQEESYREKIIFSLARAEPSEVYRTSVYLAHRYGIPKWDICMTHLDWLMTESGLSAEEVNHRVTRNKLMQTLLMQPQKMVDVLKQKTYSRLPSTRYSLIYEYFTYLQWAVEQGAVVTDAVSIETHLKLLKKFKTMIKGVDYQQLMGGTDPLNFLLPSLWEHNIHGVAKLAKNIPLKEGDSLSAEMIYRAFVEKKFHQRDKSHPTTDILCTSLKESKGYISLLGSDQFEMLVKDLLFCQHALEMSLDTRLILLERLIEMCKQKVTDDTGTSQGFKLLSNELDLCRKHIESLKSPNLSQKVPTEISEDTWRDIIQEYDLSLAKKEKVSSLTQRACASGLSVHSIQSLLSLSNSIRPHDMTVKSIVQQTLKELLGEKKELEGVSGGKVDKRSAGIENILKSVAAHEKEKGSHLVCSADVLDIVRPICSTPELPPFKRTLLGLMKQYLSLSETDFSLLLLYQTQSILLQHFKEFEVTVHNLSSPEEQTKLFLSLLEQSSTTDQLDTLVSLLNMWPNSSTTLLECWSGILIVLARQSHPQCGKRVVTLRAGVKELDPKVDEELFHLLCTKDKESALQLALISSNGALLNEMLEKETPIITDSTTIEIIIHKKKLPLVVTSPLFNSIFAHLSCSPATPPELNTQLLSHLIGCTETQVTDQLCYSSPSVRIIAAAKVLKNSGFLIEAGCLILVGQKMHPVIMNANSTFVLVNELIS